MRKNRISTPTRVTNIKSPLWDMVLLGTLASTLCLLSLTAIASWMQVVLVLVVGPTLVASFAFARHRLSEETATNLFVACMGVAAIGFLIIIGALCNSAMFHPEELLCRGYPCLWRPAGLNAELLAVIILAILFAFIEIAIAAAILCGVSLVATTHQRMYR